MELSFAAATDVGRQRNHNEDNFLIDKKLRLFMVADGMGGHAAGEVASSIAVHEIRDAIKSGGFDAVLFTSSSTVRNLVGIAGKPHQRTVVAVIGPKTAETAKEFGLRVDVQPAHASVPDLVEALADEFTPVRATA